MYYQRAEVISCFQIRVEHLIPDKPGRVYLEAFEWEDTSALDILMSGPRAVGKNEIQRMNICNLIMLRKDGLRKNSNKLIQEHKNYSSMIEIR